MTLTSSPRSQRPSDDAPPLDPARRRRSVRLLAGGASLVALAGLGVAFFAAQLGQSSVSAVETQHPATVLAAPSDTAPTDSGHLDGAADTVDGGAESGDGSDSFENPDGRLPFGTSASDTGYAGIGRLSPELREALQDATRAAEAEGVYLLVNSGWRSPELQAQLLQDAVAEYGSEAEAARWVAAPETSLHVSGDAVDVEGGGASDWLATNGAVYGLCQTYLNEPWHFEFRANAGANGCAQPYRDPTEDPRLNG